MHTETYMTNFEHVPFVITELSTNVVIGEIFRFILMTK